MVHNGVVGHLGIQRTLQRLKEKGRELTTDVRRRVRDLIDSCAVCQSDCMVPTLECICAKLNANERRVHGLCRRICTGRSRNMAQGVHHGRNTQTVFLRAENRGTGPDLNGLRGPYSQRCPEVPPHREQTACGQGEGWLGTGSC